MAAIGQSDVVRSHAKDAARAYGASDRNAELAKAEQRWGEELDAAFAWVADRIRAHAGDPHVRLIEHAADWIRDARAAG